MASSYTKVFTNPYPSGWKNLPSTNTPIIAQALQQHTNAIVAIENYLSNYGIPQKTSDLINDSITVPTKLSELTNDTHFITIDDVHIPENLSDFNNDTNFITIQDAQEIIPDKLSAFINDRDFITNTVNDLVNYYKKSEVYKKVEVDQLISSQITKFIDIKVVNSLPTSNISETTIYLVPKEIDTNVLVTIADSLDIHNNAANIDISDDLGLITATHQEVGDPFA